MRSPERREQDRRRETTILPFQIHLYANAIKARAD